MSGVVKHSLDISFSCSGHVFPSIMNVVMLVNKDSVTLLALLQQFNFRNKLSKLSHL